MSLLSSYFDIDKIMSEASEKEKHSCCSSTPGRIEPPVDDSRIESIMGRLEGLLQSNEKSMAFQVERNLMSRKIEEYVQDLRVYEENFSECEKTIRNLCAQLRESRNKISHLNHQNSLLIGKQLKLQSLEQSLGKERIRSLKLFQKLELAKNQILEFFNDESSDQNEYIQRIEKLSTENINLRSLFQKISAFAKDSKLDVLLSSKEFATLNIFVGNC